jgi:hypothetical protein
MTPLAWFACAVGGCNIVGSLAGLYAPDRARRTLGGFARHDLWGWALTAADLAWAGWLILHTPPFSAMQNIQPMVYLGAPLAFFLVVVFLDEMLAARALGGLLLLLGSPIMMAARANESSLAFIMTLLAYAWVVAGMILVVSPFRLRQAATHLAADRQRFRSCAFFTLALGAFLLLLGLTAYRIPA